MYGSHESIPTSEFGQEIEGIIKKGVEDSILGGINGIFPGSGARKSSRTLKKIENICDKFHLFFQQLGKVADERQKLVITNEYDVQNLFHSLLLVNFDDIRKEEQISTYGGAGSKADFLLKAEQTVIEIKRTRSGLKNGKLGEELIIDINRYQNHPDCKTLVCFVYDPDRLIVNPRGLEHDLESRPRNIKVKVFIRPY